MPGRGGSTFTKRQKEQKRKEKQREKVERRNQRKLEKQSQGPEDMNDNIDMSQEQEALFRSEPGESGDF